MNELQIKCSDFPFHQVLSGSCKQLDSWLDQLMAVSEENDVNILFLKLNRKGKFVVVQTTLTWISDNFMYYSSPNQGDWLIFEFDHFFTNNKTLLQTYSGSSDTKSIETTTTLNLTTEIV